MSKMITLVYDGDEYMYQKAGESIKDYEKRMAKIKKKRDARMSETEKQQAAELIHGFDEYAKRYN